MHNLPSTTFIGFGHQLLQASTLPLSHNRVTYTLLKSHSNPINISSVEVRPSFLDGLHFSLSLRPAYADRVCWVLHHTTAYGFWHFKQCIKNGGYDETPGGLCLHFTTATSPKSIRTAPHDMHLPGARKPRGHSLIIDIDRFKGNMGSAWRVLIPRVTTFSAADSLLYFALTLWDESQRSLHPSHVYFVSLHGHCA